MKKFPLRGKLMQKIIKNQENIGEFFAKKIKKSLKKKIKQKKLGLKNHPIKIRIETSNPFFISSSNFSIKEPSN